MNNILLDTTGYFQHSIEKDPNTVSCVLYSGVCLCLVISPSFLCISLLSNNIIRLKAFLVIFKQSFSNEIITL